ncbi:carbamoyl-phosphate synthase small subunit [Peribacillus deserti]|uniref:Carbamoyl phosphate synthase small chain n=1 Tax=Peribacillus deserti TaxID=673318 RepID=A0ABS2QLD0_9BACI|nr:carbamoyl phosphate synthase small subunit [Peribacillus deserti]MBM7693973.1 carbamoyl-phosphate synthase small subunit [Peribacillus deserti]
MKGYLHLKNGDTFEGEWLTDTACTAVGEVVFYTGMTGYQEVLTDPSYKGQIIVFTYPLIGNYGINKEDFESKVPHVAGVIVYQGNMKYSHYQAECSLVQYLNKWNIPMLGKADTRAIVKKIRKEGSMSGAMAAKATEIPDLIPLSKAGLVSQVTSREISSYGKGNHHIVLYDFGYKKSILDELLARNCKVTVVPCHTAPETIHALKPDGIVLSNGPGDPKAMNRFMPFIKEVIKKYPTMGICLGHQLIALAFGGDTERLLFGHRGANQPVINMNTKRVVMTSQNHGYVVKEKSISQAPLFILYKNVNDGSIEGLQHKVLPIVSVQFHPEANPGPCESNYIFDEYMEMVKHKSGREKAYA